MSEGVVLHSLTGPSGSRLAAWLDAGPQLHGSYPALVGPFPRIVAGVSGPAHVVDGARAGLPDGLATEEAVAVRLRRQGLDLTWGDAVQVRDDDDLARICRERGSSSVELYRADSSLLTELQLGSWHEAAWRARLVRRMCLRWPKTIGSVLRPMPEDLAYRTAADVAFWEGVRSAATGLEWRRLSASSYVVLSYHRLAGDEKPGQDALDLAPEQFHRQLRLLRRLGYRPLSPAELLAFAADTTLTLPRRRYVVSADDGYLDCIEPLRLERAHLPQLFVPTEKVGESADWTDGEPVADWSELRALAECGVGVGSHGEQHLSLPPELEWSDSGGQWVS